MKKYLSIFLILLLSLCVRVNAESSVEISSIEIDSKSDVAEEIEEASYKNLNINLSVRVYEKDDYIKYKINVKNSSDEEISLDSSSLGLKDSEYITYELSGDTNILANSNGTIYLTITYANEKEDEDSCTTYNENQSLNVGYLLNLSNAEEVTNPNTNTGIYFTISLITILTFILILLVLHKNQGIKKYCSLILILLGGSAIISPLMVMADNENKIIINTNVEIGCVEEYHLYLTASIYCEALSEEDFDQFDSYTRDGDYYIVSIDYGTYEPGEEVTINDIKYYASLSNRYLYLNGITENECDYRTALCDNTIYMPYTITMPDHDVVYAIDMKK